MRVMVLGATGFIGPHLVERLAARGCEVIAVSRSAGASSRAVPAIAADRRDPAAIAALARSERIDAVVDLIAYTAAESLPLIEALAETVGRYVLASSGDVYRQYDAIHRREAGLPRLERLDEEAPLRALPFPYRAEPRRAPDDPQAWMDDYDKIPIETAVRERLGQAGVVLRLPMIYGPGDRNRRFAWAIRPMLAGAPVLEVDEAWAAWRTTYGYVADVAEALALAAVQPAAAGRTWNVGPAEAPDHFAWARRLAELVGWRGEIRTVPRDAAPAARRAALDVLDLTYPLRLDAGRFRRELGFAEVTESEAALAATVQDELERSRA